MYCLCVIVRVCVCACVCITGEPLWEVWLRGDGDPGSSYSSWCDGPSELRYSLTHSLTHSLTEWVYTVFFQKQYYDWSWNASLLRCCLRTSLARCCQPILPWCRYRGQAMSRSWWSSCGQCWSVGGRTFVWSIPSPLPWIPSTGAASRYRNAIE